MIQELQKIFHSVLKSLEILYVTGGIKPCARILVNEGGLNGILEFLNKNSLNHSVSDFKVIKQSMQSEFYSDLSIKIPKDDKRNGYFFLYISKNENACRDAKKFEAKNDHIGLGITLGYPRCCCEFFRKNFSGSSTDLTLDILENSEGIEFPFYTNIAARHFDVSLLSHFPHEFKCAESIKIAKNNLNMVKKHSEQLSAIFSGILQGVVIYTSNRGIFLLRNYEKINNKIIYGNVLTTAKNKLFYLLSSGKKLEAIDKNNFIIAGETIGGKDFGVMVFS